MPSDLRRTLKIEGKQELLVSLQGGRLRLQTIDERLLRVREIAKRKRR